MTICDFKTCLLLIAVSLGLVACAPARYQSDPAQPSATLTVENKRGGEASLYVFEDGYDCSNRLLVTKSELSKIVTQVPAARELTIKAVTDIQSVAPHVIFFGAVPAPNPKSVEICEAIFTFVPKVSEHYRISAGELASGCQPALENKAGDPVEFELRKPIQSPWSDRGPWCLPDQ